jgi:hypothetical protein
VIDERGVFEKSFRRYEPEGGSFERLVRRRDRKRRNQRMAAGVVGIAVFVAAVWIVTSGLTFDRTQTPAATGPVETGPTQTGSAETGPTQTAPAPAPASAAPDVVAQRPCSDGARWRLELEDIGDRTKVRYEVHRSPPGDLWHIRIWRNKTIDPDRRVEIWRGVRVASGSGAFAVVRRDPAEFAFRVKAIDSATGEVCDGGAII